MHRVFILAFYEIKILLFGANIPAPRARKLLRFFLALPVTLPLSLLYVLFWVPLNLLLLFKNGKVCPIDISIAETNGVLEEYCQKHCTQEACSCTQELFENEPLFSRS